jgi:MFS family permease
MSEVSDARRAWWPLGVWTAINLLNYIDRYVITAVLPNIQAELHLDDRQGGLLGTAFIVVYLLVSPAFGWVGDRGNRPRWMSLGVALWSVATAAGAFVHGLAGLILARGLVGVGEAAYGNIGPALLADSFPRALRGRVLSVFFLATPVGAALGYLLGGVLGQHLGWRAAFLWVGAPGLLLAGAACAMPDPPRGAFDTDAASGPSALGLAEVYRALGRNRLYVGTVAGLVAYTFALGGLAFWMPSYMMRVRGFSQAEGMMTFGAISVGTGVVGTVAGGWLGDRLLRVTRKGYTWLSVGAMGVGAVATYWALVATHPTEFLVSLIIAQLALFLNFGPVNALIVNCVPAGMRATAMATSTFCIHAFGDAISPTLIGSVSDATNLQRGMLVVPAFFVVAGVLWATTLPRRSRP